MPTSMLMYVVQNENEIPLQPLPNTAYYIPSLKQVRMFDGTRTGSTFKLEELNVALDNGWELRLQNCEKRIEKVYNYMASFGRDDELEK